MRKLLPFLFAFLTTALHATVTVTANVSNLPGGNSAGAVVRVTLLNCAQPTVWNTGQVVPGTQTFPVSSGTAVMTLYDNVSEVSCSGNFLSYYSFVLVAGSTTTQIGAYELPAGRFNLANLASISTPPTSPGVIQGPQGPEGPSGGAAGGPWNNTTSYAPGAVVVYGGSTYVAMVANQGVTPGTDSTKWVVVSGTVGGIWNTGTPYPTGAVVQYGSSTYLSIAASQGVAPDTDTSKWQPVSGGGGGSPTGTALKISGYVSGTGSTRTLAPTNVAIDTTGNNLTVPGTLQTNTIATGAAAPTACGSATGCVAMTEGNTIGSPVTGQAYIRADVATHQFKYSINGSAESNLVGAGGGGSSPGGAAGTVQFNNSGALGGTSWTFNPATNVWGIGGVLDYEGGGCVNPGLVPYLYTCDWKNIGFGTPLTPSGGETRASAAKSVVFSGKGVYSGFPVGADHSFFAQQSIVEHNSALFLAPGFKRVHGTNYPGYIFASPGDASYDATRITYQPGLCCAADEGNEFYLEEMIGQFGYPLYTANTISSVSQPAVIAAGQSFTTAPTAAVNTVVMQPDIDPSSNGFGYAGTWLLDQSFQRASGCGTIPRAMGTDTYFAGSACGTFPGNPSSYDAANLPFLGKIPITVAAGTVNPVTAIGTVTSKIGDENNQQTMDNPVAQTVTVTLRLGSFPAPSTGQTTNVCITGYGRNENGKIFAVGTPSGGTQTVSLMVRYFHNVGAAIIEGDCSPQKYMIFTDDANYGEPYPLATFGTVNISGTTYLLFDTEGGGGVGWDNIFQPGARPATVSTKWTQIPAAQITANYTGVNQPANFQYEDNGLTISGGDKLIAPPFPASWDRMRVSRHETASWSNPAVNSGGYSIEVGGSFGYPGEVTRGYRPFTIWNYNPCTNLNYFACGGKVDPPDFGIVLAGQFANEIAMQPPSRSHFGDAADALFRVGAAVGTDYDTQYNMFNLAHHGNQDSYMAFNAGAGDILFKLPDNSGVYISQVNMLGFQDFFTHNKYGCFSASGDAHIHVGAACNTAVGNDGVLELSALIAHGSGGQAVFGSDASGNGTLQEHGGAASQICTAANGVCLAGGSAGVSSLNSLTGALTIAAGSGISITPSGSTLTIANTGSGGSGPTFITMQHTFSGSGSYTFAHTLGTMYPIYSCYVNSGSTTYTVTPVDANNMSVTVPAASNITCTFAGVPSAAAPTLVSQWKMDDGSGSTAVDSSTNGNNLALGGTTWTLPGQGGFANEHLLFDGSTSYGLASSSTLTNFDGTTPFSVNVWVNTTTTASQVILSSIDDATGGSGYPGWSLNLTAGSYPALQMVGNIASSYLAVTATSPGPAILNLAMYTVTYDGSRTAAGVKMYANGTLLTTTTDSDTLSTAINHAVPVMVGARRNGSGRIGFFSGHMGDLRVYSRVLSPTDITALYTAGD